MSDFDNTNSGVLFKNDRKTTDKHPDYKGSVNVGGVEHWLSAWLKTGKNGKFMSLAVTPKDDQPAQTKPNAPPRLEDMDDVPF